MRPGVRGEAGSEWARPFVRRAFWVKVKLVMVRCGRGVGLACCEIPDGPTDSGQPGDGSWIWRALLAIDTGKD